MAEIKQIATRTITTIVNGIISIYTSYIESAAEGFINFFISSSATTINDVFFEEGQLGYTTENKNSFSGSVNNNGELVLCDDDVSNYFLDGEGYLICDTEMTAPEVILSYNSKPNYHSLILEWNAVIGAEGYRIDIGKDSQFCSYLSGYRDLDLGDVTGLSIEISTELLDQSVYVRLRAYNSNQTSANSTVQRAVLSFSEPVWENDDINALFRNLEGDLTLSSTQQTAVTLVEKGTDAYGYYYVVNNLPEIRSLIETPQLWGLWSLHYASGQPDDASKKIIKSSYLGDYSGYSHCYKLWTSLEVTSVVGNKMAIMSPVPTYAYKSNKLFPRTTSSTSWAYDFCISTGAFWRKSDGTWMILVAGYNSSIPEPKIRHHLYSSTDPLTSWTDLTGGDNDALAAWRPSGYAGIGTIGGGKAPLHDRPGYYAVPCVWRTAGGSIVDAIFIFNEDLSDAETFLFQTDYTPQYGSLWAGYTSLTYHNGKYMWFQHDGTGVTIPSKRVCLVSDTIDGVFHYDHTMLDMSTLSDYSPFRHSFAGIAAFEVDNTLYIMSSGEGSSYYSGNYYNHEVFLWRFIDDTKEWVYKGNLLVANHGSGFGFTWGYDHCGAMGNAIEYGDKVYFAHSLRGGYYEGYIGYFSKRLLLRL